MMDLGSSLLGWILYAVVQLTGITGGETGSFILLDEADSGIRLEYILTEVPVEDYWTVQGKIYVLEDKEYRIAGNLTASGYKDDEYAFVFSVKDDSGNQYFSVNEAGGPLELPLFPLYAENLFDLDITSDDMGIKITGDNVNTLQAREVEITAVNPDGSPYEGFVLFEEDDFVIEWGFRIEEEELVFNFIEIRVPEPYISMNFLRVME